MDNPFLNTPKTPTKEPIRIESDLRRGSLINRLEDAYRTTKRNQVSEIPARHLVELDESLETEKKLLPVHDREHGLGSKVPTPGTKPCPGTNLIRTSGPCYIPCSEILEHIDNENRKLQSGLAETILEKIDESGNRTAFLLENHHQDMARDVTEYVVQAEDSLVMKLADVIEQKLARLEDLTKTSKGETQGYSRQEYLVLKNQSLERKNENLRAKLQKAQKALHTYRASEEGQRRANPNKTSDASIRGVWGQIVYGVRNLAANLAEAQPTYLKDEALSRFQLVYKYFGTLMDDENSRCILVEGYLWRMLDQQVFAGLGRVWGGEAGLSFKTMKWRLNSQS